MLWEETWSRNLFSKERAQEKYARSVLQTCVQTTCAKHVSLKNKKHIQKKRAAEEVYQRNAGVKEQNIFRRGQETCLLKKWVEDTRSRNMLKILVEETCSRNLLKEHARDT